MKEMPLYKKYENTKPIGVFPLCNFGGVEILDIINGYDTYVVACFNFGTGRQKIRKHKVCYPEYRSCRPYFWKEHKRYYMEDFMRTM